MRQQRTSGVLAVLGALLAVMLGPAAAAAQAPEREVIPVNGFYVDVLLSRACGVQVTHTITGTVTILTYPDRPVGPQELQRFDLEHVIAAGDNQVWAREVGIRLIRVEPDGTVVLSIVGQVPYQFTGVLKVNYYTGQAILEPHHVVDIAEVCAQLTG